jgi:hypothetical protein
MHVASRKNQQALLDPDPTVACGVPLGPTPANADDLVGTRTNHPPACMRKTRAGSGHAKDFGPLSFLFISENITLVDLL